MSAVYEFRDATTLVASGVCSTHQALGPSPLLDGSTGYLLGERLAVGGMGSVYFGLKTGALGFQRVVAIKRLHAHLVDASDSVSRFKDEIRIVSRLSHPNLVQTFDVLESHGELVLVMEYVDGETLCALLQDARAAGHRLPVAVVVGILSQALHGLHAAHEARSEDGHPLNLVHRDVSPHNIMVDKDGLVKMLDFGIAKATSESHVTRTGEVSGKIAYMSPEHAAASPLDRRSDLFAAGIVLWEALTGERLFRPQGTTETAALLNVLTMRIPPPSELCEGVPPDLDRIVLRALDRDPGRRFGSARDFAIALEEAFPNASVSAVANTLASVCGGRILQRTQRLRAFRAALRHGSALDARHATDPTLCHVVVGSGEPRSDGDSGSQTSALEDGSTSLSYGAAELQTRGLHGMLAAKGTRRRSQQLGIWLALGLCGAAIGWFGGRFALDGSTANAASPNRGTSSASTFIAEPTPAPKQRASQRARASRPETSLELVQPESLPVARPPSFTASDAKSPRTKRLRAPTSSRATSSSKGAVCSPPSYVDADGIRHFKPECL